MKVFILSILILGLCGTVGNCEVAYDSVLVCDTAWAGDTEDHPPDIHCWYNHITYDPTISLPLCTVFVPCTVYVESRWVDSLVRIFDSMLTKYFKERIGTDTLNWEW